MSPPTRGDRLKHSTANRKVAGSSPTIAIEETFFPFWQFCLLLWSRHCDVRGLIITVFIRTVDSTMECLATMEYLAMHT